ncbi:DUF4446 family protein [Paenibacillus crassostreae]|uniref:DUF4446 domain-containing protein n=1 Tax=Paenibacillus crassostreae TaxID=1763538 RepID=A0A162L4X7_9BACL|nr:DUF4446 family protein [Paenibacillus crassostreae]AOZ92865.1 hypothetical protein LPB68_12015 [Paenibacillus crassostreae]OAB72045.1 hypothetical protein PNBC_18875 [Paenibacillus crassostreae]
MSELNDLVMENLALYIGIIMLIVFVLLALMFTQLSKLNKLRRRYEQMMAGTGVNNLESLLIDLKIQLDRLEDEHGKQKGTLENTMEKLQSVKGHVGLVRYNAFGERGSDLSFSVAMIDDQSDGVVLTSIYNRDNSYIYAKPLQQGDSSYSLSNEEKEAINLAKQKM